MSFGKIKKVFSLGYCHKIPQFSGIYFWTSSLGDPAAFLRQTVLDTILLK